MKRIEAALGIVLTCFLLVLGGFCQECRAEGPAGTNPVYRFYNTQTGTHFFTISESEKDHIIATYPQFTYEGIAWYAYPPNGTPTGSAQWGVSNGLYCKSGDALTFSVTLEGTSRKSVTYGEGSTPTFEGWVETTTGVKTIEWSLVGCGGDINMSGSATSSSAFEADKRHLIIVTFDDNGELVIRIGVGTGTSECGIRELGTGPEVNCLEAFRLNLPQQIIKLIKD